MSAFKISTMKTIIDHVSVGVNDLNAAGEFYDCILSSIDIYRKHEIPGQAIVYGDDYNFWINTPLNDADAVPGNGVHIAFRAVSTEQVDRFYQAAIRNEAELNGEPGYRTEYGKGYYAAFIKDPDGNKIEVVYRH